MVCVGRGGMCVEVTCYVGDVFYCHNNVILAMFKISFISLL